MKHSDIIQIVPGQFKGEELEVEASQTLNDEPAAQALFEAAKKKLLFVNNWHNVAGAVTARFQIIDKTGNEVHREVKKDDYLRIDIPGPGSKDGDGYDWVHVEDLKEINEASIQSVGFRVRPHENPFSKKKETAHFYSKEATSSFIVSRENEKVFSWIVDRNLLPNTESASLVDKVRDVVIGISGIAGFSKIQWQGLADGLIGR